MTDSTHRPARRLRRSGLRGEFARGVLRLFVETDEAARGAIRENIDALGLCGATRIHRRDATDLGLKRASAGNPFDPALLDPPCRKGLGEKALSGLTAGGWLKPGSIVIFKRASDEPDVSPAGFEPLDARDYGAARVQCMGRRPEH